MDDLKYRNFKKLRAVYEEHGKIIIGVDFDDTIFSLEKETEQSCQLVRKLLKECVPFSTICLYTVADNQSLSYKVALMREWGFKPDFINESPVKLGNGDKPFFNILLDDKAGLKEAYETLEEFQLRL